MINDFKKFEGQYGDMFHLLLNLDKATPGPDIRFVSEHDQPMFTGIDGHPVFFDHDKNFKLATDFIIIYPKVYVRASIMLDTKHLPLERVYLH